MRFWGPSMEIHHMHGILKYLESRDHMINSAQTVWSLMFSEIRNLQFTDNESV